MHVLSKQKRNPHTTNFRDLKNCVLLGNESLPTLSKSGNTNYESAPIMGEITEVIGITLEEEILCDVRDSPLFSLVIDEATDISVTKQLGLCSLL